MSPIFPRSYRELQKLAKNEGIKANQKREVLEVELRKIYAGKESLIKDVHEGTLSPNHDGGDTSPDVSAENSPEMQSPSKMKAVTFSIVHSVGHSFKKALSSPLSMLSPASQSDTTIPTTSLVQDLSQKFGDEYPGSCDRRGSIGGGSGSSEDDESGYSNFVPEEGSTDKTEEHHASEDPNVAEITAGMNNLALSVDIDGKNATKETLATDLPPLLELCFEFPAGNFGLILQKDEYENTEVKQVKKDCPLRDYIIRGDILLSIDDLETRKLPLDDVVEIAAKDSYHARNVCFGRNVAKRQDPKAKSRRQGMSTSAGTTGMRSIGRSAIAATSRLVPTNIAAAIAHAAREKAKAVFNYKGLKAGFRPTKFSQVKGRESEDARERLGFRFMHYDEMVTPWYQDEDGNPTSHWEPIIPFLVIVDPYKPTKKTGGRRTYKRKHLRERRKITVLVAQDKIQLAKAVMKDLCETNFASSSHYEVEFVSCKEDFMVAMNGDRTLEKAKTPKKKTEEQNSANIHLAETPMQRR